MIEISVLACRPVAPSPQERAWAKGVGLDIDTAYPGSVKAPCVQCDREVWVGPRQQKQRETAPHLVVCFFCLPALEAEGDEIEVRSLGGTHPTDEMRRPGG